MADFTLADLERIVADARPLRRSRIRGRPSCSRAAWTRPRKKLGEEAVETVIAAVKGDAEALVSESADLLYHLLVVLALAGVPLSAVLAELERRTGQSGIAEKASRKNR